MTVTAPPPRRILIIDDDQDSRYLVMALLTEQGYLVSEASDGIRGLALVRAEPPPDLILLDVVLPLDLGGWEVCRQLKADSRTRAIPIIMLTGQSISPGEARHGMELGADEYVIKPFIPDVLLYNIARLLEGPAN